MALTGITGSGVLGKRYGYEEFSSMAVYNGVGLAYSGLVSNNLAFVLWFKFLRSGNTARMAGLVYLTPFLAFLYPESFPNISSHSYIHRPFGLRGDHEGLLRVAHPADPLQY